MSDIELTMLEVTVKFERKRSARPSIPSFSPVI